MFQKLITVVTRTSYFVDMVLFMWIFFERGQTCHLDILYCVELLCLVTISNHVQLTDTVLLIKAAIKIGVNNYVLSKNSSKISQISFINYVSHLGNSLMVSKNRNFLSKVFVCTKNERKYFCNSALVSKMGQIIKRMAHY